MDQPPHLMIVNAGAPGVIKIKVFFPAGPALRFRRRERPGARYAERRTVQTDTALTPAAEVKFFFGERKNPLSA